MCRKRKAQSCIFDGVEFTQALLLCGDILQAASLIHFTLPINRTPCVGVGLSGSHCCCHGGWQILAGGGATPDSNAVSWQVQLPNALCAAFQRRRAWTHRSWRGAIWMWPYDTNKLNAFGVRWEKMDRALNTTSRVAAVLRVMSLREQFISETLPDCEKWNASYVGKKQAWTDLTRIWADNVRLSSAPIVARMREAYGLVVYYLMLCTTYEPTLAFWCLVQVGVGSTRLLSRSCARLLDVHCCNNVWGPPP